jgi:hypothetical protein
MRIAGGAMRFLPQRTLGQASAADPLVIVPIADAVRNGISGEYRMLLLRAGVPLQRPREARAR